MPESIEALLRRPVPPPTLEQLLGKPFTTYLIGIEGLPFVKIGHTTSSPTSRMATLQTGLPLKLSLLWSCEDDFESELHVKFAAYRVRGEWFDLSSLGDPVDVVKAAVGEIEACR